jgi:drug/metabolite transporter (DMT)-like permease
MSQQVSTFPQQQSLWITSQRLSQKSRLDWWGILLVVLSAAGFGTLGIFGKLAYAQGFSVVDSLFWRVGGGAGVLWAWLLLTNQWRLRRSTATAAFWLGCLGYTLQAALFFGALQYASAGITALLLFTYPAFVALIRWLVLRQSLAGAQILALMLAFGGCLCTVNWGEQLANPIGLGLGLASGAGYAIYLTVSARLVKQASPIQTGAYMLLGSATVILGVALSQHHLLLPNTLAQVGVVSGLAIVATALPIVCLFVGLKRLGVIPAAIFSTLEPVMAVVLGVCLLKESLWSGQFIGGALILMACLLLQTKGRTQR